MTLPPAASQAAASESETLPDNLIAPAAEIFDLPAVRGTLFAGMPKGAPETDLRKHPVKTLRAAFDAGRAKVAEAFAADPFGARRTTRSYTWITDCIVHLAFEVATEVLHRLPNPTEAERLSVLSVGGYGRGEMAPFSDVDLLFLTPYKITPWAESVIESMLYILWDLRLKVGHSSRTVRDCLRLGAEDFTIRTAMLEHRFLTGHAPLAEELDRRLWSELFEGSARDFVEAKLAECKPNVKTYWGGGDELMNLVRSGEVTASMAWDTGGWKLNDDNADITFVAPASGALGWIDTFVLPAKGQADDVAYEWINFVMQPEIAAMITAAAGNFTASAGADEYVEDGLKAKYQNSFPQEAIDNIKWYPPVPAGLEAIEGEVLDRVQAAN